ncbi:NAD(P)-dependent oxidoreductase [Arthrobacter sp. KNU40]|uniref:NAD(P)-dependent oxidoreductase n=1 Tax=Arthrobacter sp. KNU40 TaxID=3447965 RepID=UPI003F6422FE
MKFLVLGATGTTGSLFLGAALSAGHDVIAYVRSPYKLAPRERLTTIAGNVHNADEMVEAMRGVDAVVSTLGLSSAAPNDFSANALRTIVAAAERTGTRRVVIMSAFGVGVSLQKASLLARLMYKSGGSAIYADKAAGEKVLTASDLDWTLAYPVLLTNKPRSGAFQAIDLAQLDRLPGLPRISRADVAEFLLDAATTSAWSRRIAVLTDGK